jgi:two-component system, sensor histidine kinase
MPRHNRGKSAAKRARKPRAPRRRRRSEPEAREAALAAFVHEIRTPLTGILALAELLDASGLGERERKWIAAIKDTGEHLASLTTLVIDAAKAKTAGLVLRQDVFEPRRLSENLAEALRARAAAKGLTADVAIADDLPQHALGDPVRLRAALENLLDNAVKFTERGTVRLEVSGSHAPRNRSRLIFTVTDSGIGLKPAEIKRLFQPFAQASADVARRFGGSGLGLAFVKRLARAMGGDLKVSGGSRGSTFVLDVVVGGATAGTETKAHARTSLRKQATRSLRILGVEDNPYGRVVLNTILTELGHRADFVGTGEAAVEAVGRGGYDVVLLDVMLSGIDGIEAARRIRALPTPAGNIAIIGISGRGDLGDARSARAAGMDDYLIKPLNPSALATVLEKVDAPAKN